MRTIGIYRIMRITRVDERHSNVVVLLSLLVSLPKRGGFAGQGWSGSGKRSDAMP